MTNQDLTKSILLCSKILKKVVPKVIVSETALQVNSHNGQMTTMAAATAVATSPSVSPSRDRAG
jgi:hypothetical protein